MNATASVPAVESQIALDAVRRGLPAVCLLVAAAGLVWGTPGVASAGYGAALALANLLMAAASLAWAARLGPTMLMGVALFGYLARLGLITVAVLAVAGAGWVNVIPLGLALVVTHLGLLVWEARYVSMSLAWPGVKPRKESA
jgi:hypothetical protein